MKITIFTPTYNRAHTLPRLYNSILAQSNSDFEWLIIDDGSTDSTQTICTKWAKSNNFIRYYKVENGGKAKAINRGSLLAKGEWFFIVDSDDWLPENSIDNIIAEEKNIKSNKVAVLCGQRYLSNGKSTNRNLRFTTIECTYYDFKFRLHGKGDLAECIRTDILRQFPFPDIPEEKFCPEAVLYNRIARRYLTHYFNKDIYHCEYQPDGLSSQMVKLRSGSWKYSLLCYSEQANCPVPLRIKVRSLINFWRFYFCKDQNIDIRNYQLNASAYFWKPFGLALHIYDKIR